MSVSESPELWRDILVNMKIDGTPDWELLWHLYAQSDNALTVAQIASRLHIPEDGVLRLMNWMGMDVAEQTGWFGDVDRHDGWQVFFSRRMNSEEEWVYSIKEKFLPILAVFRKQ